MTPRPIDYGWWLASRASGLVALALFTFSVLLGLLMAAKLWRRPGINRTLGGLHEHVALAGLIAIAVHGITLLGDRWLHPGVSGILVPFTIGYEPVFTGLGIVGGYLAAALGLSFYLRRLIGARLWRQAHRATIAVYVLAVVHTLGAGSDSGSPWLRGFLVLTGAAVLFLFLARTAPAPAPHPTEGSRLVRRPIVIAGGGLAAVRFCQALRRAGDDRPIRMVCEEPHAPYDRPPLSKELAGAALRPDGWYADNDVQLLLGERAVGIDLHHRALALEGGAVLPYEALLIATGSRPRPLEGCLALRTVDDAQALREVLAPGARVVIVGAGFVGQEVAATARAVGAEVTMVEALPVPLAGLLGAEVGAWFARLHREEGVRVELGVGVDRVEERAVVLQDGRRFAGDAVLAGIGVVPASEWLAGTPLGGGPVHVDVGGRTCVPGVLAAGDVTGGQHWDAAARQGAAAARTLLGLPPAPAAAPSFWSDQYGVRIQMVGRPAGADAVAIDGDPTARDFAATFTRAGRAVAVLLANRPHLLPEARRSLDIQTIERNAA